MLCSPTKPQRHVYVLSFDCVYLVVNAAVEKLLTFSDDNGVKQESSPSGVPPSTTVKEDSVRSTGSDYSKHQLVDLPPLFPKQDSLNSMPYISPSSQWVYHHPYSICGPPQQQAIGGYQTVAMPSRSSLPHEKSVMPQKQQDHHNNEGMYVHM